jgi:hypothetical protein
VLSARIAGGDDRAELEISELMRGWPVDARQLVVIARSGRVVALSFDWHHGNHHKRIDQEPNFYGEKDCHRRKRNSHLSSRFRVSESREVTPDHNRFANTGAISTSVNFS